MIYWKISNCDCLILRILQHFCQQMKNEWSVQRPLQQKFILTINDQLSKIKSMNVDHKIKLEMLSGIISLLKQKEQIQKVKAQQNISTSFSEDQSNFTVFEHQIEQLEDRILQKRSIKFQINQEIQGVEEDLYQVQKTVDTKKEYDERLRKQIQFKMKRIERKEQKKQESSYLDKSLRVVTGMFRGWIN